MTLIYKNKCCVFFRGPPYMYIILSYKLCSISICSTEKFKLKSFCALMYTHTCHEMCVIKPPRPFAMDSVSLYANTNANCSCKVVGFRARVVVNFIIVIDFYSLIFIQINSYQGELIKEGAYFYKVS